MQEQHILCLHTAVCSLSDFFHEKYDKRDHTCRLFHGPPWLYFETLILLNFDFKADPDPAFHSTADPNPASKNNAMQIQICNLA
jgi:hypothetical protein